MKISLFFSVCSRFAIIFAVFVLMSNDAIFFINFLHHTHSQLFASVYQLLNLSLLFFFFKTIELIREFTTMPKNDELKFPSK